MQKKHSAEFYGILFEVYNKHLTACVGLYITDAKEIQKAEKMCDKKFSRYGAWLEKRNNLFYLTGARRDNLYTGGYRAAHEAINNPAFAQKKVRSFIEECLSGITPTGRQSAIERAALPSWGKKVTDKTAEELFEKANIRFAGRKRNENDDAPDFKKCKCCGVLKERPPSHDWAERQTYCRACEGKRQKGYREERKRKSLTLGNYLTYV